VIGGKGKGEEGISQTGGKRQGGDTSPNKKNLKSQAGDPLKEDRTRKRGGKESQRGEGVGQQKVSDLTKREGGSDLRGKKGSR